MAAADHVKANEKKEKALNSRKVMSSKWHQAALTWALRKRITYLIRKIEIWEW